LKELTTLPRDSIGINLRRKDHPKRNGKEKNEKMEKGREEQREKKKWTG